MFLQRFSEVEKKISQRSIPNNNENEAKAALSEINVLRGKEDYDKVKVKIAEFIKKYSSSKYLRSVNKVQKEVEVIGKAAPEEWGFDLWFQGQEDVDLDSGAATLLVFWEVWCPHCTREVPKLQELYHKLSPNGLQLVGVTKVNKSSTEEKVLNFISDNGVEYPIAKEDGSISKYFNVSGIPAAAVVANGVVVWRGHPSRLTDEKLQTWL